MSWSAASETLSIAVLAGGDSAERAVSLASGSEAAAALASLGHRVEQFDPLNTPITSIDWPRFDICFLALHGGAGEDGRVQQQLDELSVVYTGSGPAASRMAMSKSAAKHRFVEARVPTPTAMEFGEHDVLATIARECATLGWPLAIKPEGQGSSLGVGRADNAEQLAACVTASRQYDPLVLVEPWIDGREFTVTILGREPLPLLEIVAPGPVFDYDAKYLAEDTVYRFDSGLPADQIVRLRSVSVAAAAALDTRGLVRVDLMLDRAGRPWVLEVNTIPGLTPTSLAPRAAAQAGFDLPALCEWMVRDALHAEVRQ
ncbi:MAG: D-alanine--D-alanine ligase [Planctomycetes bacterium]|nr:D-alanine--D-alanine ligase [Planctomycetota bacterium]